MKEKLYISFLLLLCIVGFLLDVEAQVICNDINDIPGNDLCENAYLIDNNNVAGNTCCGEIEGLSLCTNSETGVWYVYTQSLNATIVSITNQSITGGIGVEIYIGQCDNLTLLARSDCSGFSIRKFDVPNCSGQIYIHVTSTENGCGEFLISTEDVEGCEFADNCEDITNALTMHPVADGPQVCASSCLDFSCLSTCTDASVWFKFHTDDLTTAVQLQLNNIDFDPMISVYRGTNCADFDDILLCEPIDPGEFRDLAVTPDFTYFVEVSLADGMPGAFDLCISAIQDYIECSSGELTVTRPENPDGNPNGPYCPGETVVFCYDMQFFVDTPDQGNGCQWLQGIVPVLGGGWDLTMNRLEDQNPTGWFWFDDVDYNVDSPVLALGTDPNGNKTLEYGPGGLKAGEILPGGWYFVSNGTNSGCTNDGHPDNMWGVNFPCGQVYSFSHCFELTTKSVTDIEDCNDLFSRDLSVTIFNFADGETGCYTSLACSGDTPVRFEGQLDCTNLVDIQASSTEICSGDFADIPVGIQGDYEIPLIVEVIDAGNTSGTHDWIFETGSGLIPDRIVNEGNKVETITYRVRFYETESVCNTPEVEFSVLVYPDFDISMQDLHVLCEGEDKLLSAPAGHDAYAWFNAETNEFLTDNRHYRIEEGGFYRVEVTEDLCTKSELIEVQMNTRLPDALDIEELQVCNNYIGTLPTALDLSSFVLNGVMGAWYDESGQAILDPSSIDFEGRPAGRLAYEFHTTNAAEPCPDTTYTVDIIVQSCLCPELDVFAPANFCAVSQNFDLNNIILSADPGTWAITSGPDVSAIEITANQMAIDTNVPEGTYGLTYSLSDTNVPPLCPSDTTVYFDVNQKPEAEIIPSISVCNIYTGTLQDSLDLDLLNISGSSGVWSVSDSQLIIEPGNLIRFDNVEPGTYTLVFRTDDARAPCVNTSYETELTVDDCRCPEFEISPLGDMCIEDMEINLEELETTNENGNWSLVSGPDLLNVRISANQLQIDAGASAGTYTLLFALAGNNFPPLCPVSSEISFALYKEPAAMILSQGEACNEDTGTLPEFIDLDDYNISGSSGIWTTTDPAVVIDGSDNTVVFTSKEIRTYDFVFTTDSAIPPCEDQAYPLMIELLDCSCPSVELGPLGDFCLEEQSINLNDIKITQEEGTWSVAASANAERLTLSGNELHIPADAVAGMYSVVFELDDKNIGPDCPLTASVDFLLIEAPEATIAEQAVACNAEDGEDPYILDLDDYKLDGSSGDWSSLDPDVLVGTDNTVDFNLLDPGDYSFEFTTNTAQAPCEDVSYSLNVNVRDCLCPALVINAPGNFCQEEQTYDLGQLIVNSEPGSWTIEQRNGNMPEIQGNELQIFSNSSPGSYTLRYTLDDQNIPSRCENAVEFEFKIFELPKAEILDYAEVCNNYIGSLDTSLDLNDLHMSGDFGAWRSLDPDVSIEAMNIVDFTGMPAGDYMFEYTTNTAFVPCVNASYLVTVRVIDCQCPALEILPLPDMCSDDEEIMLDDYINADMPGEWRIVNGPSMSEIDIENNMRLVFDKTIDAGTYTLEYAFTGSDIPSLCAISTQAEFTIIESPYIDLIPEFTACNAPDSGFADVEADLDDFVQGSAGTWSSVSPGISIDPDNRVSFEGLQAGLYLFEYTTDVAQVPCENLSGVLEVRVENCVCPVISFDQDSELCNDEEQFILNSLLLSSPGQGMWQQVDGPEILDMDQDNVLNINNVQSGRYTFEFEILDAIPQGCENSGQVSFFVNEQVQIQLIDFIEVCDRSSSVAPECIDLNDMVTGDAGFWTAPANYTGDFSDIGEVCFTGLTAGETYVFVYQTDSAEEACEEKSGELIVSVLDCRCPNIDIMNNDDICNNTESIDLGKEYELPSTVDGHWVFLGGPEMVNLTDEVFTTENISPGDYRFEFIPDTTPPSSCAQSSELLIRIYGYREAGNGQSLVYCDNEEGLISFYELLDSYDAGGQWELNGATHSAIDMASETIDIGLLPPGTYAFEYYFEENGPCGSNTAISDITILLVPVADAGPDAALSCMESEFVLGGDALSEGPEFRYEWTDLDSGNSFSSQAHPLIDEAGTYQLEVINMLTQCSEFDIVSIVDNSEQLYFEYAISYPDCLSPNLAVVSITDASGGDGDYLFSVNNGSSWSSGPDFELLAPGDYTLMMIDGNNCDYEETLSIQAGISLNVWAGEDMEIEYGDEWIPLQVFTDALDEDIAEIIWEMDGQVICQGSVDECYNIEVDPMQYNEFCVTVIDINGCEETDCMSITELLDPKVYIPNVFNPTSYDRNAWFYVQTNDHVVLIKRFLVMDRWGGTVFENTEDTLPNEARNGWDGRKLQKEVEVGVYTYHIIVEDVYGETHSFAGEVTLLR